jgi:tetratricopeptide (TPR) repeat protein
MRINQGCAILLLAALILAAMIPRTLLAFKSSPASSTSGAQDEKVEALIRAGHWKRARAILEPQLKTHPDDPRICYLLAEVKFAFNDLDGAQALAQHAVDLDGKNSNYHLQLGKTFGEMAARARFLSAASLAGKFRKEVEVAIELDPKNLDALDAMMQFKYQAPGIMGGSKDEANSLADKITQLNATEGYLSHAELAGLERNPAKVEGYLLKAVHANPRNYDARAELAKFYSQSHKYDEAGKQAQYALQIDPRRIEAYWILARIFAFQQQWGNLQQILSASEKSVPDDLRAFYEAGESLVKLGKELPRAEGYAKKYLSQEPEGEEPDAADAHRLMGTVLEKERRSDEARVEFKTAMILRPNFKGAKEDLKRLEH